MDPDPLRSGQITYENWTNYLHNTLIGSCNLQLVLVVVVVVVVVVVGWGGGGGGGGEGGGGVGLWGVGGGGGLFHSRIKELLSITL